MIAVQNSGGAPPDQRGLSCPVGIPLGIVAVAWVLLFSVMHVRSSDTTLVAAALGFTGVVVTACVSAIGVTVNRQAEMTRRQGEVRQ